MIKNTAAGRVIHAISLSHPVYHIYYNDSEESKALQENKVIKRPGTGMQKQVLLP